MQDLVNLAKILARLANFLLDHYTGRSQGKYLSRFLIHCKKRDIFRAKFLHLASFLQDSCYLLRIVQET